MPLIAALTPSEYKVSHTDEIVEPVRFDVPADLVAITAPTPSALHAYGLAREFRRRGVPVVIGGPHATALPEEAVRHADAVVVGEAEDTWPRVLDDARLGRLESISQKSLEGTNKAHNCVDDYTRIIANLHGHGIAVHLGIMFGFDEDDVGIFRRTADFLDEACVDVATVSMVVPMPGTPTFRRLNADRRILTTDWSRYDGKKHCVFEPARMSPTELEAGTEGVARRFYSPQSIFRRLAGSQAGVWWNLPRNVGYMLAGLRNAEPSWDPALLTTRFS